VGGGGLFSVAVDAGGPGVDDFVDDGRQCRRVQAFRLPADEAGADLLVLDAVDLEELLQLARYLPDDLAGRPGRAVVDPLAGEGLGGGRVAGVRGGWRRGFGVGRRRELERARFSGIPCSSVPLFLCSSRWGVARLSRGSREGVANDCIVPSGGGVAGFAG